MSSSRTSGTATVDVTMPQMGVSVAEGTVVEWRKQPGDWVEADEIICAISTDKIDTDVPAPATGRVQEILVDVGDTVDVGTVLARIATDARPGEAHAVEQVAATGPARPPPRWRRPARPASSRATRAASRRPTSRTPRGARRRQPAGRAATRRSCSASPPSTASTSTRCRARAAAGACASRTCSRSRDGRGRRRQRRPSRRCTSSRPYRPEPRPPEPPRAGARRRRPPRGRRRDALAHAPLDRRAHEALAGDRGDVHDLDRGRHVARRAARGRGWASPRCRSWPAATIDALRELPRAQRVARGRDATPPRRRVQPRHRGLARRGRADRPGHPRRPGPLAPRAWAERIRDLAAPRARAASSRPTTSAAARSRSPTRASSARSWPRRSSTSRRWRSSTSRRSSSGPSWSPTTHGEDSIAIRPMRILGLSWDHRALDGALAAQFLAALKRRVEAWD